MNGGGEDKRGGLWKKLPSIESKELGKLGPGFGAGAGCGFGVGLSFIGVGLGIPGAGFGIGCGVGVGFGYGFGKGIAHDGNTKLSNVQGINAGALVDKAVVNTKKLIWAATTEIGKLRR